MELKSFLEIVEQQGGVKYLHITWLCEWCDEHGWDFDKAIIGLNTIGIIVFDFTDNDQMVVAQPMLRRATRVERGKLNQEADISGEWDSVEALIFAHIGMKGGKDAST